MQSTRNTTPSDEFFPSDAVRWRCVGGALEVRRRCYGGASGRFWNTNFSRDKGHSAREELLCFTYNRSVEGTTRIDSAHETPSSSMSFLSQAHCVGGAPEPRRRCVGGASEKQNRIAQRQFGVVPNIETHVLQTSNRTPIEIGCFWRVPIALSSFRNFLNPLLCCFENSISKSLQRGIRTCPIFFKKIGSDPNSIDMYTAQFLARLMKNCWSELET